MANKAVISSVGADQPGIVAAECAILAKHGCNIEDSTMTRLGQEFASIMIVTLPGGATVEALASDMAAVEKKFGLALMVKAIDDHLAQAQPPSMPFLISVAGRDHTGITQRVAEVLAEHKVNITDLNAQVIPGEDGPVYMMILEGDVPDSVGAPKLEAALQKVAPELGVEIALRAVEPIAL